MADRQDAGYRAHEADDVGRHRQGRAEDLGEQAAGARARHEADGLAELEAAVGGNELVLPDQGGEVGEGGGVEQHGEDADAQGDGVHELDPQHPEERGQRDRADDRAAAEVGPHHERPAPAPVGPHAGRQCEQQRRQVARRLEDAHLRGRGVEGDHGREGQRDERQLPAQQGRAEARPELLEVAAQC
jgi:hypothetical protein